jgi:cold shock CspA family protein
MQKVGDFNSMTISKGRITRYNPEHLFGFIQPNCGGVEVFFHLNDLDRTGFRDKEEHSKYVSNLSNNHFHEVEYLTRFRTNKNGVGGFCAKEIIIYIK